MASRVSDDALRALLRTYATSPRCALARRPGTRARRPGLAGLAGLQTARLSSRPASPAAGRRAEQRRGYAAAAAAAADQAPRDIAVLGGGLTGLSTAYYLAKFHPGAKITVYEGSARLGGWVDTETVEVESGRGTPETVVFERGPRTVAPMRPPRYDDMVLYELIDNLKLQPHTYALPKDVGPAGRRYIYYPDHLVDVTPPPGGLADVAGLARMGLRTIRNLLTEPLFEGALPSLWNMTRAPVRRLRAWSDVRGGAPADGVKVDCPFPDESIGDYFAARFGRPDLVDRALSALVHGVYGGDVWKLSVHESLFARAAMQEYLPQLPGGGHWMREDDFFLGRDLAYRDAVREALEGRDRWSFLGFYNGFATLPDAMAAALRGNPDVAFRLGDPVTSVKYDQQRRTVEVKTRDGGARAHDKVVSTLYSGTLAGLAGDALPSLRDSAAVTIQLVNLWYPTPRLHAPHTGFGYLVPNARDVENPYGALGVIFDSDREAARGPPRDPAVLAARRDGAAAAHEAAAGTKLTVMLGGHHWDRLPAGSWPDAAEAARMARATVEAHLGVPPGERCVASAKVCRACIPQQVVGHRRRMAAAHGELLRAFGGALAVAGGSYTAPGVLPALRAGRDAAMQIAGRAYRGEGSRTLSMDGFVGQTGLARFLKNEWMFVTAQAQAEDE